MFKMKNISNRTTPYTTLFLIVMMSFAFHRTTSAQIYRNYTVTNAETGGELLIPPDSALAIAGNFTLELWVTGALMNDTGTFPVLSNDRLTGTGYGLYISARHPALATDGVVRLIGRNSVETGAFHHVAATYDSAGMMSLYFDGVLDTSLAAPPHTVPRFTMDTVYLNRAEEYLSYDEIRIWNRSLTPAEINDRFRISLTAASGLYQHLVLSLPFQDPWTQNLSYRDFSGHTRSAIPRGEVLTSAVSGVLSRTIAYNQSLDLDGTGSYAMSAGPFETAPATALTLEAWVFPRSYTHDMIIAERTLGPAHYRLGLESGTGQMFADFNGFHWATGRDSLPLDRWSHVAFTFDLQSQTCALVVNGSIGPHQAGLTPPSPFPSGADTLFIGSDRGAGSFFDGMIDEVIIVDSVLPLARIQADMMQSADYSNLPANCKVLCYSFDGTPYSSTDSLAAPLTFYANARFSAHDAPATPLLHLAQGYPGGYHMSRPAIDVPPLGSVTDTITVTEDIVVTSLDLYLGLQDRGLRNLRISLVDPLGHTAQILKNGYTAFDGGNLNTVFDDNESDIFKDNVYPTFSPAIRPESFMNGIYIGQHSNGAWKIMIHNLDSTATASFLQWGLNLNQAVALSVDRSGAPRPKDYFLLQNYPNPFNPTTKIQYALPRRARVVLKIYNMLGQAVATLADGVQEAGDKSTEWDGANFASGIYFYRLEATGPDDPQMRFTSVRKMLLIR